MEIVKHLLREKYPLRYTLVKRRGPSVLTKRLTQNRSDRLERFSLLGLKPQLVQDRV